MTRKPSDESVGGANGREEACNVWQVARAASRGAARESSAGRSRVDNNSVRRFDPIAVGRARDGDAVDDVVCASERPWPRIFPGL